MRSLCPLSSIMRQEEEPREIKMTIGSSQDSVLILIAQLQSLGLENVQFFMCLGQDDTLG